MQKLKDDKKIIEINDMYNEDISSILQKLISDIRKEFLKND